MILVAFLLPVAIYLLVLANLNGRDHPVAVGGAWDFAGILFAVSGFLMFGVPAFMSNFSERGRRFLWLGLWEATEGVEEYRQLWVFLYLLYTGAVLLAAALLIWRSRRYTAIYNVDAALLERALERVFTLLSVAPVRSGSLYLFGLAAGWTGNARSGGAGLQPPHYTLPSQPKEQALADSEAVAVSECLAQSAILEVESFPTMRHATLHWDPADATLRPEIEHELKRLLAEMPVPDYTVCTWQSLLAQLLFAGIFFGGLGLLAWRLLFE